MTVPNDGSRETPFFRNVNLLLLLSILLFEFIGGLGGFIKGCVMKFPKSVAVRATIALPSAVHCEKVSDCAEKIISICRNKVFQSDYLNRKFIDLPGIVSTNF